MDSQSESQRGSPESDSNAERKLHYKAPLSHLPSEGPTSLRDLIRRFRASLEEAQVRRAARATGVAINRQPLAGAPRLESTAPPRSLSPFESLETCVASTGTGTNVYSGIEPPPPSPALSSNCEIDEHNDSSLLTYEYSFTTFGSTNSIHDGVYGTITSQTIAFGAAGMTELEPQDQLLSLEWREQNPYCRCPGCFQAFLAKRHRLEMWARGMARH